MDGTEGEVVRKLNQIVNQILSSKRKVDLDIGDADAIEDEGIKSLAGKIVTLGEQYRDCYGFMVELSSGRLYTEPPRSNAFANPFKQLHSELRHLTWQIQEIANGDYDQNVSFSGDFAEAINKMIFALRERKELSDRIRENENLFRSIFSASPDGIVQCDLNHCIINASNAALRMFNVTEEIIGNKQFSDLIHPDDQDQFINFVSSLFSASGITAFVELRIVPPKGMTFWSEMNANLLYDSNGDAKGYIIVFRDITERKMAEAQLLQYTDELDESNRTKDKLFSIIAHDLRSPFSALLGTSKILVLEAERETVDMERIKMFLKTLYDTTGRTYDLLINLLEWSRLQSNRIAVNPEPLNLSSLVVENIKIGNTVAAGKNIMLNFTTPGDYPLTSDRAIVNTVLRNLISNAIKYTPQNGLITVAVEKKDSTYQVSVKDSGVGITPDNLAKLFKLDTIKSTPGTANEKGTGLGLVLCKDFVNKLGGNIWVESVYGQGATFSFTLRDVER